MTDPSTGLRVNVAMAEGQSSLLRLRCSPADVERTGEAAGELPFMDRSVSAFQFDDSVVKLSVRDRLQLLLECRRCLKPGGEISLPATDTDAVFLAMARWAALVGLAEQDGDQAPGGWRKHSTSEVRSPLVSILIPSSNPRYFLECLDSALAQTYRHIEIIVCDDFEGVEIEAMVRSRHGRVPIDYYRNEPRLRTRLNYEKLLSLSRGEYIKFLNDDDRLEPDCVAALLRPFLEIPDLSLATSHRQPIDANSRPLEDIPATRPVVAEDVIVRGITLANAVIMYGLNFIGEPSTMLFRKRDFARRPHLDGERPFHFNGDEVRGAADLAMASRVLVQGNAAFLRSRLSSFRRHGEQAQSRPDVVSRSIDGIRGLQRQWIELGLFRRAHPNLLETRAISPAGQAESEWTLRPVLSFAPIGNAPAENLRRWRETARHAFDFVAPTPST